MTPPGPLRDDTPSNGAQCGCDNKVFHTFCYPSLPNYVVLFSLVFVSFSRRKLSPSGSFHSCVCSRLPVLLRYKVPTCNSDMSVALFKSLPPCRAIEALETKTVNPFWRFFGGPLFVTFTYVMNYKISGAFFWVWLSRHSLKVVLVEDSQIFGRIGSISN